MLEVMTRGYRRLVMLTMYWITKKILVFKQYRISKRRRFFTRESSVNIIHVAIINYRRYRLCQLI